MTLILPSTSPSVRGGYLYDTKADINDDHVYRIIQVDEDRYSGAYSGCAYTAWPGIRPDDIDAGDMECHDFWAANSEALHGRGNSPQAAFRDLTEKIAVGPFWDWDVTLSVVMLEGSYGDKVGAFVFPSKEFDEWLAV